jgi:hypothetical protein
MRSDFIMELLRNNSQNKKTNTTNRMRHFYTDARRCSLNWFVSRLVCFALEEKHAIYVGKAEDI